jgi:hypothetical protein
MAKLSKEPLDEHRDIVDHINSKTLDRFRVIDKDIYLIFCGDTVKKIACHFLEFEGPIAVFRIDNNANTVIYATSNFDRIELLREEIEATDILP